MANILMNLLTYKHKFLISREAVAKEEAKRRYQAATAAGKTDEAKADLARLAIIRQQREEAARKREEEKKGTSLIFLSVNTHVY